MRRPDRQHYLRLFPCWHLTMALLPAIADWRIYPGSPEHSVFFGASGPLRVEGATLAMARALVQAAMDCPAAISRRWSMVFEGVNYRCETMPNGGVAVRVIPHVIPSLDELNIPVQYQKLLLEPRLQALGGLVVVCGMAGSGKSTTLAATTHARLLLNGGYALTYENPLEFSMQGWHGEGYCDQNTVDDLDYAKALSGCLRCFPSKARSMLLVGEILDTMAMREVTKVMMNGHLVLTSSHGRGIIESIQRLLALSGAEDSKPQREMLATSLRLVIHQKLDKEHLSMTALQVTPSAEQLIAQGSLLNLKDEIARTEDRLLGRT